MSFPGISAIFPSGKMIQNEGKVFGISGKLIFPKGPLSCPGISMRFPAGQTTAHAGKIFEIQGKIAAEVLQSISRRFFDPLPHPPRNRHRLHPLRIVDHAAGARGLPTGQQEPVAGDVEEVGHRLRPLP